MFKDRINVIRCLMASMDSGLKGLSPFSIPCSSMVLLTSCFKELA